MILIKIFVAESDADEVIALPVFQLLCKLAEKKRNDAVMKTIAGTLMELKFQLLKEQFQTLIFILLTD